MKPDSNFILFLFLISVSIGSCGQSGGQAEKTSQPNIVLIMLDDVSPDLFSCYGLPGAGETPNIDRLAREGVQFRTCYAASICAPTRAMIMTGRYGARNDVYFNSMWVDNGGDSLFIKNYSMGRLLKEAGYATAIAGKWHCGSKTPVEPEVGFEEYCLWEGMKEISRLPGPPEYKGGFENEATPSRYWHPSIIRNHELLETRPEDFGPEIFCDFICDFMERKVAENKPFFAYWPSVAPHGARNGTPTNPLRGEVGLMDKSPSAEENTERFKSLNEYLDLLVGRVIDKVEELGIADNTLILFTSDNGTAVTAKSRGVERGPHVPCIYWGGMVKQRGETDELTDFTDIVPTLLDLAGAEWPEKDAFDGKSLMPFLQGETDSHREWIYGFVATSQIVRSKEYLLEAVNSLLDYPEGRLYYTGNNRYWKDYRLVNNEPGHDSIRAVFNAVVEKYSPPGPTHPFWESRSGKNFLKMYTTEASREKHLHNHRDFRFNDE